jgi:hypothetical protein
MSTGLFLDDPADFAVPPDDRVQLAGPGHFRQVLAVLLHGLEFFFRGLVRDPLRPPQVGQGLENGLGRQPLRLEQLPRVPGLVGRQGPEQVFGGDVFILHLAGLLQGLVQDFIETG